MSCGAAGQPRLRNLNPVSDRGIVEELWRATLEPAWPLLPDALDLIRAGVVAELERQAIGVLALDEAGCILLTLVKPRHQRQGTGTALIEAAMERLLAAGVRQVSLGSGGGGYIWPGVPTDLPNGISFFQARGWSRDHIVSDLICDLRRYTAPRSVHQRVSAAGTSLGVALPDDQEEVASFEERWFPEWAQWFRDPTRSILLARDSQNRVVGSLLFSGPSRCSMFWPMLGEDMAIIGCVGVAEPARGSGIASAMVVRASELLREAGAGTCHIGWAWRPSFYERLGYERWRDYLMTSPVEFAASGR